MRVELCFYIRISYDIILGDLICEFLEDGDGNTNWNNVVIEQWTEYLVTVLNWILSLYYSVSGRLTWYLVSV